jgi:GntR family galactonate operon transcriptional repressor
MSVGKKPGRIMSVVTTLGSEIARGERSPGSFIAPEHELALRFGVGRGVIREAMKTLAGKGLVSVAPREGTKVLPRSNWVLMDRDILSWMRREGTFDAELLSALEEFRSIFEPESAALAATRADEGDRLKISTSFDEMAAATTDEEAVAADIRFHLAILDATRNPVLQSFRGTIEALLSALFVETVGAFKENLANHGTVADAIAKGDGQAARMAMRNVLATTREHIQQGKETLPVVERTTSVGG